ncbi:MAG: PIN domain-containing protein [Peptococcaceae bacterium]|jgi:predicted nucleic acid-binding protein|nr:PIN domain-containing protein [Peptococcaceae bacterium]
MADAWLLDSSALMALMEDEDGSDTVADILRQGKTIIPFLVLMEIYYISLQESGQQEADRRWALIKQLPSEIVWDVDEATVLTAARFKAFHRLSVVDALIAAYAKRREAVLLHKDPEYQALAGELEFVILPLKKIANGKTHPQKERPDDFTVISGPDEECKG